MSHPFYEDDFYGDHPPDVLAAKWPNWSPSTDVTSVRTVSHNCLAFALGDTTRWWEPYLDLPGTYWPEDVEPEFTIDVWTRLFERQGYEITDSPSFEAGYERVAIYGDAHGEALHAARQLDTGSWASKLGDLEDVIHTTLEELEGGVYGSVVRVLRRRSPRAADGPAVRPVVAPREDPGAGAP